MAEYTIQVRLLIILIFSVPTKMSCIFLHGGAKSNTIHLLLRYETNAVRNCQALNGVIIMANIVLKFNDNKKKETAPMEVYRDISIVGVGVPAVPQPVEADYMVFLQAENVPASDIQAITTEVSESSDPYYLIALALNIDYEEAVRRYNKWKNSAKYNVGKLVNVKAV